MKRLLLIIALVISVNFVINADDNKSFKCEGTNYSSISSTGRVNANSSAPINTGFTWTDAKGISYPIYISDSGSCYIIKKSKNTGKEYKSYLSSDVSQDICRKIGKTYKSKIR